MINFSHLKSGKETPPDLLKIQQQNLKKVATEKKALLEGKKSNYNEISTVKSDTKKQAIVDAKNMPESGPSEPIKNRDKIELAREVLGEKIEVSCERDFSPEKINGKFKSALIESGQIFSKSDHIIKTLYCFGCYRMSAEMIGTDRERFYCRRDITPDGDIPYIRIKPEFTIGQCKFRLDIDCPF